MTLYQYPDYLMHYGVKGMRWGIRKKYYNESSMNSDRIIKKGSEYGNISFGKERFLNSKNSVYAYGHKDKNAYEGAYASNLTRNVLGGSPIKNTLRVNKDVKVASQKHAVDTFVEMYNKDPKGMSKSIAQAHAEVDLFNGIDRIRNYKARKIEKKFSKKGEDWLRTKGYEAFNQGLMSSKETKARDTYYEMLRKKGYGAVLDVNDVNNGSSKEPLIFINAKSDLTNVKHRQLNIDEIELANARYNYDQAKENRTLFNDLMYGDYYRAKSELKRVEKKYNK